MRWSRSVLSGRAVAVSRLSRLGVVQLGLDVLTPPQVQTIGGLDG